MKPHVIVFNSISLDGRIDFNSGHVDMGTYYTLAASWNVDAMLSGSNTMLSAFPPEKMLDPATFEKPEKYHPFAAPLLVAVDSKGRIRNWNYIRSEPFFHGVVVLCSETTPKDYLDYLARIEIDYIITGKDHIDSKIFSVIFRSDRSACIRKIKEGVCGRGEKAWITVAKATVKR